MDIWSFLTENSYNSKSQYKKWLDVSSSHFSLQEYSDKEIGQIKKIIRTAQEVYQESGRYLIYQSSTHFSRISDDQVIPVFLRPVSLEYKQKQKELEILPTNLGYLVNPDLDLGHIELEPHELEDWLHNTSIWDSQNIKKNDVALFFDLDHRRYSKKDLQYIIQHKLSSSALRDLFHDDIRYVHHIQSPDFLSLVHGMVLDQSQAEAITLASEKSCHIVGPPGTGKSQTIVNLAINELLEGKKVAILSQKKVALDVIYQRIEDLSLLDYCLFLNQDAKLDEFYISIEQRLDDLINFKRQDIRETFNLTYFKHCVRTLEDYFYAREHLKHNRNAVHIDDFVENYDYSHPLFSIYIPNEILLNESPIDLIGELIEFQNYLKGFDALIYRSLDFIVSLEGPLNFVSKVEITSLKKFLKSKRLPAALSELLKEKKRHLSSKPDPSPSPLIQLGRDKLEYLMNYLTKASLFSKLFNPKIREILKEIEEYQGDWKSFKIWEKIEWTRQALDYLDWEHAYSSILERERMVRSEVLLGIDEESLRYIQNKLDSNIPAWIFAKEHWIQSSKFEQNKWQILINKTRKILRRNPELKSMHVVQLMQYDFTVKLPIDVSSWVRLCSLNFKSYSAWNSFKSRETKTNLNYPVLKNYTAREIVKMSIYIRQNYSNFARHQLRDKLQDWNEIHTCFLLDLLKSKKHNTREQRIMWKQSVQFVQKKWSQKRKKPTCFQAFRKLDLDFLLWLKPLTIASFEKISLYYPLQEEIFDTVILDEASQIELSDSIPALVRAKKVVVVGDGKQLTPSRFFHSTVDKQLFAESILELAEEKLPTVQLNYHYRAKFQELIQYSNTYFYNNALKTNSQKSVDAIQRIYLKGSVYSRRVNNAESIQIVQELKNVIRIHGLKKTIGIITFSIQQKEVIEAHLEKEMLADLDFSSVIAQMKVGISPFFVKNLEQVQGDERDIILISTGYGNNQDGKLYLFFGPILFHKGENRLNVLMSRAKEKIIFVTSLLSSDIRVHENSSRGMVLFKRLLQFVENPASISYSPQHANRNSYWDFIVKS